MRSGRFWRHRGRALDLRSMPHRRWQPTVHRHGARLDRPWPGRPRTLVVFRAARKADATHDGQGTACIHRCLRLAAAPSSSCRAALRGVRDIIASICNRPSPGARPYTAGLPMLPGMPERRTHDLQSPRFERAPGRHDRASYIAELRPIDLQGWPRRPHWHALYCRASNALAGAACSPPAGLGQSKNTTKKVRPNRPTTSSPPSSSASACRSLWRTLVVMELHCFSTLLHAD